MWQGLDSCTKLEELSLERNCIKRLEGFGQLIRLRRLSIGYNCIGTIDGLEQLVQLQYLSLESNAIATLTGLQKLIGLSELYANNNLVHNIREVFCLKVCDVLKAKCNELLLSVHVCVHVYALLVDQRKTI